MNSEFQRFKKVIEKLNSRLASHKHPRSKTKFKGIGQHAVHLGVTREHLFRVLIGERQSPGLISRYNRLKKDAKGAR